MALSIFSDLLVYFGEEFVQILYLFTYYSVLFLICWVGVASLSPTKLRLLGLGTSTTGDPTSIPSTFLTLLNYMLVKIQFSGQGLWCMPLIQESEWQMQEGLCKFKAILVYISSSSLARPHNEILYQNKTKENKIICHICVGPFMGAWFWFFLNSFLCPSCPG